MTDVPRKQQDYFNKIKEALSSGDNDMLSDLVRTKSPLAIRNDLSTTLGQHVRENYDNPLNVFQNKDILEDVPVNYSKLPEGIASRYSKGENKIYLPYEDLNNQNRQMGSRLHEYGHANDALTDFEGQPLQSSTDDLSKLSGLQSAEDAIGQHHSSGFFEKDALEQLLQNKKLGGTMADNSDKLKLLTKMFQNGQITPEMYKANVDKYSTLNQNMRPDILPKADELSGLRDRMINNNSMVQTVNDMPKTAPDSMVGIKADVAANNKFPSTTSALEAAQANAKNIGQAVAEDVPDKGGILSMLKNSKGLASVLPAAGLGAVGLAGLGVAKTAADGNLGQAGLQGADLATDFFPGLGQAKFAMRPTELGSEPTDPVSMPGSVFDNNYTAVDNSGRNPAAANPSSQQPLIAPDDRAKADDLKALFAKTMGRIK